MMSTTVTSPPRRCRRRTKDMPTSRHRRPARPRRYGSARRRESHDYSNLVADLRDGRRHTDVLAGPLALAAIAAVVYAVITSARSDFGWFPMLVAWRAAAVLLILMVPALRRALVSDRVLPVLRRALPPMSQTERDALEAGTVWCDAELFSGRPNWEKLLAVPAPQLSAEEQAFLDGPVEELCRMLDDWKITQEQFDLPPE